MNGGNPLNDCPIDWDKAKEWQECANAKCEGDSPEWSWDCGFKLDFDGPLLRVSSRFYPPKTHYGDTWDGNVTIYIFDKKVSTMAFDCKTLDELKIAVESYIMGFVDEIEKHLNNG
ncbi:hypothetical protein LCGC14_0337230 [marine sediment metagenome]|uniref:Uncharacterized protein n=1 Tax=marine sediment metagenome TaxID=412755 RepID=A0A0F9W1Y1_9ZZZZ